MKISLLSNTLLSLVLASSVGISTAGAFDLDDFYAGASVVQTYVDENGFNEDTLGGKIYGGYNINDYFSLEASYYDLDSIEDRNNGIEIDGFGLGLIGSYPATNRVSLFAKIGAHDWDTSARGDIRNSLSNDSDTDLFYGLGAKFRVSDNLSLRIEAERFEVDNIDLDVASLGLTFGF